MTADDVSSIENGPEDPVCQAMRYQLAVEDVFQSCIREVEEMASHWRQGGICLNEANVSVDDRLILLGPYRRLGQLLDRLRVAVHLSRLGCALEPTARLADLGYSDQQLRERLTGPLGFEEETIDIVLSMPRMEFLDLARDGMSAVTERCSELLMESVSAAADLSTAIRVASGALAVPDTIEGLA